jgi:hypothetical protein
MNLYIEKLTSNSSKVLLELCNQYNIIECIYIDSEEKALAKHEKHSRIRYKKLDFSFDTVRDKNGVNIGHKIEYGDTREKVLKEIKSNQSYNNTFKFKTSHLGFFLFFLERSIATISSGRNNLWSTLYKIHVVSFHYNSITSQKDPCYFILEDRLWKETLLSYAKNLNVVLQWQPTHKSFREILLENRYQYPRLYSFLRKCISKIKNNGREGLHSIKNLGNPKIVIESFGVFNLRQHEIFSDIAYWHQSQLCEKSLLLYTRRFLSKKQYEECRKENIDIIAVSIHHEKDVPHYLPLYNVKTTLPSINNHQTTPESNFVQNQINDYNYLKNYWLSFFERSKAKVHVTHFKNDNTHIAQADALNELGGISALWQLSYEDIPCIDLNASSDIMFAFSPCHALTEQKQGSKIRYHVATGYPGDYRFPLLKRKASEVRKKLKSNGVKKIIAFFDENSSEDGRWSISNSTTCKEYGFFLEKILSEPWLGVVFKPKRPNTLYKRLESINDLMDTAIKTGRCHFFMSETNKMPPAIAALAADFAIHSSVMAGTAGLEAALTGVPTLLKDRDNWKISKLYELGEGKVIFNCWEDLWETLANHWKTPQGIIGLGDWSPLLDELDPFRDGKAAERMGAYLHWLIQGFEEGLDKELIMADAAEKYSRQWGADKITTNIGL